MIDEYKAAGIDPTRRLRAVVQLCRRPLLDRERAGVRRAGGVPRRPRERRPGFDRRSRRRGSRRCTSSSTQGVKIIAPPIWAAGDARQAGKIVPSAYAEAAKAAGLNIITWTLERSGPLDRPAAATTTSRSRTAINNDGDTLPAARRAGPGGRRPRRLLRLAGDRDVLRQLHGPRRARPRWTRAASPLLSFSVDCAIRPPA